MLRTTLLFAVVVAALTLLAAACGGGGSDEGEEAATTTIAGQPANDHGSRDVSGEDELELEADDFYFEPTVLTGSPGQTLKIDIENEGSASHTFTIDDQDVDVTVEPGDTAEVEVTFPDSGEVRFYCSFHEAQAMAGALETSG
jgi:plastocyanin